MVLPAKCWVTNVISFWVKQIKVDNATLPADVFVLINIVVNYATHSVLFSGSIFSFDEIGINF